MTDQSIPQPVADFIATVNAHDDAGFLDSFTDDAFVDDWGRTFTGRDEIKG
ncbi:nuclear transport factor 2 family protein, partial [Burkholderia multivorans]